MKKHTFLGLHKSGNSCCVLRCLLPFDALDPETLDRSDFTHYSTNWCGCDSVERLCEKLGIKPTGRKICLPKAITFRGVDDDMGHSYPWTFEVSEIWETE